MVVRGLLIRGLLVGLAAGLLAFAFAKVFGEPQIDKAIAFEDEHSALAGGGLVEVSRDVQSTLGLLIATGLYALALGGIFALVYAAVQGRIGRARPRVTAAVLALAGFVVIFLVPFLKYPSNPPAVGSDQTIADRTKLYFMMVAISIAAAIAALRLGRGFVRRFGAWNGTLAAIASYIVLVATAALILPLLDEIPAEFPADVIWRFRVATVGTQAVIWATLGLGFGALAERLQPGGPPEAKAAGRP